MASDDVSFQILIVDFCSFVRCCRDTAKGDLESGRMYRPGYGRVLVTTTEQLECRMEKFDRLVEDTEKVNAHMVQELLNVIQESRDLCRDALDLHRFMQTLLPDHDSPDEVPISNVVSSCGSSSSSHSGSHGSCRKRCHVGEDSESSSGKRSCGSLCPRSTLESLHQTHTSAISMSSGSRIDLHTETSLDEGHRVAVNNSFELEPWEESFLVDLSVNEDAMFDLILLGKACHVEKIKVLNQLNQFINTESTHDLSAIVKLFCRDALERLDFSS